MWYVCIDLPNCEKTYYSYLRKSKRIASVDETELQSVVDPNAFIEEQIGIQDETRQIRKILHTIPEPYKEIFMWRVFGELSFKEIGDLSAVFIPEWYWQKEAMNQKEAAHLQYMVRRQIILWYGIGYLRFSVELIMCVNLPLFQCQSNQPIHLVSHEQRNVQHIIVQLQIVQREPHTELDLIREQFLEFL